MCRTYESYRQSSSLVVGLVSVFYKLILIIVRLNEKLLIHDYAYHLFVLGLILMPSFAYLIRQIPLRFVVYSTETIKRLDNYHY